MNVEDSIKKEIMMNGTSPTEEDGMEKKKMESALLLTKQLWWQ